MNHDLAAQQLGQGGRLRRRRTAEAFGEDAAALVPGGQGGAEIAALGLGAKADAPDRLLRRVDRQHAPRLLGARLGRGGGGEARGRGLECDLAQAAALLAEPGVEGGVQPVQIGEQLGLEKVQRLHAIARAQRQGARVGPYGLVIERDGLAGGDDQATAVGTERLLQFVQRLAQGTAGLLLPAPAPQQISQALPGDDVRCLEREHREHTSRFARARQQRLARDGARIHPAQHGDADPKRRRCDPRHIRQVGCVGRSAVLAGVNDEVRHDHAVLTRCRTFTNRRDRPSMGIFETQAIAVALSPRSWCRVVRTKIAKKTAAESSNGCIFARELRVNHVRAA